jgi:glutamate-1-semialdehyde 2,1-aminomutase/spore coat polysaccharide biosynthesis protein SpsF
MKKMKIVAIVQARLGSTRLPQKVLEDLGGKSVLDRVIDGAARIPGVDEVVVAIPSGRAEEPLRAAVEANGKARVFAGSHNDVLDRYYRAAKAAKADVVLRITADCPLLDPEVSGRVLKTLLQEKADYASNISPLTFPDGLDTEAFRFKALERAWKTASRKAEREHVTPFLRNHPELFKQAAVTSPADLSHLRLTVDEPADLEFLRALIKRLNGHGGDARLGDILSVLRGEPALLNINGHIRPNEGYYKTFLEEKPAPARKLRLKRSLSLYEEAKKFVPGCSQTFSKAPSQFVRGVAPLFLQRGKGARVWDVDGNEFVDLMMSLGPVSLGYCDPEVDAAVAAQLKEGTVLSQPHPLETEVSKLLAETIPCAEMTRFGKAGSDATSAAIRLSRYLTKRDLIAVGGYHGWHDWYIGTTTRNGGVPAAVAALTKTFQYNKIESLERIFRENPGQVAAVILEPIGVDAPLPGFLEQVAELTRKNGALLVFDEVITGFRLSLGGAQKHFGVIPDLASFGKAMANGFPLSAVVGRAELMRNFDDIFFSGTFGGETLSLAACKATIEKMKAKPVIPHMWEQGRKLQDGYNTMARALGLDRYTQCAGLAPHTVIGFKNETGEPWWELKSLMQQECVRRGHLFTGVQNPSWALTDTDVEVVLRAFAAGLRRLKTSVDAGTVEKDLEGPPVQAVFRKP